MKLTTRAGLILFFAAWINGCGGNPVGSSPDPVPTPTATPNLPAIYAAGDISCDTNTPQLPCRSRETSDLALAQRLDRPSLLVLPLGDLQYDAGTLAEFRRNYHNTWARLNPISRPVPGNHEYDTRNASGYFDYFIGEGVAVGDRNAGWYSYDVGDWHFIALNSNCERIGGCQVGSPQYRWLQSDLLANRRQCTVAYLHHPFLSTGRNGNTPALLPFMRLLHENKTEIVLAGHDHDYERFVPITPDLVPDPTGGLRLFVVGTGGRDLTPFARPAPAISAFRTSDHFGGLRIVMRDGAYDWAFISTSSVFAVDSGSAVCF